MSVELNVAERVSYLRQEIEPGVVKHRRWDAWVGVCYLLDLVGKPEHHLSQKLRVGLKNISSMTLRETQSSVNIVTQYSLTLYAYEW